MIHEPGNLPCMIVFLPSGGGDGILMQERYLPTPEVAHRALPRAWVFYFPEQEGSSMKTPRIVVAAPGSGHGKTTVSMGLMAALKKRGYRVQPYKVGPDYIDPAFHAAVTDRPGINLDSWMLDAGYIKDMVRTYSDDADISVIEGVMGLYDGMGSDPLAGSTAGVSRLLDSPVVLVIQAKGMSCSAAAMVYGMKTFKDVDIRAVIVNKPSSVNHYRTVKQAIEMNTGVKVIGYLPDQKDIELKSRHLGLVQSSETEELPLLVGKLTDLIEAHIDLEALIRIAEDTHELEGARLEKGTEVSGSPCIAVAKDKAFNFYYHENLQILRRMGANLRFFSPLEDSKLPDNCCGLYIGGGYPEVFAEELEANAGIRQEIKNKALGGMPVFAECGGFMYLNRSVEAETGEEYRMVGIFEGRAYMTNKLQNFGYAEATALQDTPFLKSGERVRVHEFHKSLLHREQEPCCVSIEKQRDGKLEGWQCGMTRENVFGMYPHLYFPANMQFASRFAEACKQYQGEIYNNEG